MSIFLDSSDVNEVDAIMKMGVIRGVTTNPTIMCKNGIEGGVEGIKKRIVEIANRVHPLPVSVEVLTNDKDEMIRQALEFKSWCDNVNVKITIHGPSGQLHNLEVIHLLETRFDVRVNTTATMNAQQCYLAAMAGSTYVSIFGGRINNMGHSSIDEIHRTRRLLDAQGLKAKIIVGSIREVLNVTDWLIAGAHIVTVTPELLRKLIVHPYTKETVKMFLEDASRLLATTRCHDIKN